MITSPAYYYRQHEQDLPEPPCSNATRAKSILAAALPIISYSIPQTRTPLSIGLGGLRSVTHLQKIVTGAQQKDHFQTSISSVQLLLSLSALALIITSIANPHFNRSTGLILFGVDEIVGNLVEIRKALKTNDKKLVAENVSNLISSLLYISFISFGHIEILATCMLLQVAINLHKSLDEFKKGHYIEGLCHLTTSMLTLKQVIPQMRVIEWKWRTHPTLEGELCRDARGFVYVKVKDEILFELNELFGDSDLPPYFGRGKHGAHITVIPAGELGKEIPMSEIGKTIKFTIAFCDTLKPGGASGTHEVSFLSVSAPELDAFRSKYGLTPKVHNTHDFHVTFGQRSV